MVLEWQENYGLINKMVSVLNKMENGYFYAHSILHMDFKNSVREKIH